MEQTPGTGAGREAELAGQVAFVTGGAAGIGFATLRAAKKRQGVESRRVKKDGKEFWEWHHRDDGLPPLEPLW